MASIWRSLRSALGGPAPQQAFPGWKGVTAFHLWWAGSATEMPAVEVSAVLEVLEEPSVASTYFWALQAGFSGSNGAQHGAAHTGLQWYPRFSDNRAVNWGGYAQPPAGGVLPGSAPTLPGFADDVNTRAYPWRVGVPYRFRIRRGHTGWAATVTDLASGEETLLRELHAGGDVLTSAVVWAEVFARCDAPTTTVRWSAFEVVGARGEARRVDRVRLSLPITGDCPNTDVTVDDVGFLLRTGVQRGAIRNGDVLQAPTQPGPSW